MYEIKINTSENTISVRDIRNVITVSTSRGSQGPQGEPGETGPTGPQGPPGEGVPTGGVAGQILTKQSNADYDSEWQDPIIESVNGQTGTVVLDKSDVDLGNVDNTSDADKPISNATQAALDTKEDVSNKSTSTTLGTSNTLYPSQNAVKTYVDSAIGGLGSTYLVRANNLSDLTNVATARTNLGLVAGGTGDIWVEKAGDTMTGDLVMGTNAVKFGLGDARVFDDGNLHINSDGNNMWLDTGAGNIYLASGGSGNLGIGTSTGVTSRITLPAATNAAGGVLFGSDTNLYRSAADTLRTDDAFVAGGAITGSNLSGTNTGDQTATTVSNTPAGNISATNVQAALNELDTEKASTASLGNYVLKAGDTMTGTLSTSGAFMASGNFSATTTVAGVYIGIPTGLSARMTLATGTANETRAIDASGGLIRFLNSSAGTVLGTINTTGLLQLAPPTGSTSGTHTLTIGSTGTGVAQYNTSDQTTNIERVRQFWSGNVFNISGEVSGTGTLRPIRISSSTSVGYIEFSNSSLNGYIQSFLSSATVGSIVHSISGNMTSSSGLQYGFRVSPTVAQTSTAGYTALLVNPSESTTGSGSKLLMDLQVGNSSKFSVDRTGKISSALTQAYTVTNPSVSRTIDVNAATLDQVRAVLGTLIADFKAIGPLT